MGSRKRSRIGTRRNDITKRRNAHAMISSDRGPHPSPAIHSARLDDCLLVCAAIMYHLALLSGLDEVSSAGDRVPQMEPLIPVSSGSASLER